MWLMIMINGAQVSICFHSFHNYQHSRCDFAPGAACATVQNVQIVENIYTVYTDCQIPGICSRFMKP